MKTTADASYRAAAALDAIQKDKWSAYKTETPNTQESTTWTCGGLILAAERISVGGPYVDLVTGKRPHPWIRSR